MTYAVVAHDYKDKDALARRMRVRPKHLDDAESLMRQGILLYAVGLTNEREELAGSIMIFEVRDRAHLDEILKVEAYVTGKVWEEIQIFPGRVPPAFLTMRPAAK